MKLATLKIEHAAKTRALPAGTIWGSGTVSNQDENAGCGCLVEKRMLEIISAGKATTPFLKPGDAVEISMRRGGENVFGSIRQTVVRTP